MTLASGACGGLDGGSRRRESPHANRTTYRSHCHPRKVGVAFLTRTAWYRITQSNFFYKEDTLIVTVY